MLAGIAAWLLGWSGFSLPGWKSRTAKTPGSVSRVRSAMIEMELDHDTGAMGGTVLAGTLRRPPPRGASTRTALRQRLRGLPAPATPTACGS